MNRLRAAMSLDMTTDELRSRLGRVGIWMPPPERIGVDPAATAAAIERAGFTSVWVGGGNPDQAAFARLRAQLAASERLIAQVIPSGPGPLLERVQSHLDAGADHVVIQSLDAGASRQRRSPAWPMSSRS
jgi:hypothetical protein